MKLSSNLSTLVVLEGRKPWDTASLFMHGYISHFHGSIAWILTIHTDACSTTLSLCPNCKYAKFENARGHS